MTDAQHQMIIDAFTRVEHRIDGVEERLEQRMDERFSAMDERFSAMEEQQAQLRQSIFEEFDRRMAVMGDHARATDEKLEHITNELGALTTKVDHIDRRQAAFEKTVGERFDAVDQRFEEVDQRFDAVDQRFEEVDQRFDTIEVRLANGAHPPAARRKKRSARVRRGRSRRGPARSAAGRP